MDKYRKIVNSEEFKGKSSKEQKIFLNKLFKEQKKEFFEEVSDEEFEKRVEFEISENKRLIEEKLNKRRNFFHIHGVMPIKEMWRK